MAQPLINGTAYSWSQIRVNINGTPLIDITSISYKTVQEKTDNYGQGNRPTSRGRGRKTVEASITLRLGELEALRNSAPNRDILDVPPFDISVAFIPENNGVIVAHSLKNAEFLEDPVEANEGDNEVLVEVPLIVSHIEHEGF